MYERILVVDDEPDAANTLARLISIFGYEARAVYNGNEAVEEAARLSPEMVLIDIEMPDVDGYETARRIRSQPGGLQTILVAVTGWTRREDKTQAYACGFDLHVAKPLTLGSLMELLRLLDPMASPARAVG
jgi:CheY-like chemotaxis protein